MTKDSSLNNIEIDKGIIKMYSDLCIPLNQPDFISVQIIMLNNNNLTVNFALWTTILDVKHFILPILQLKIGNKQQIKCIMYDENHQLFEAGDHTVLKHFWNNCSVKVFVSIESYNEEIPFGSNVGLEAIHPEYGNVLDTNASIPKRTVGYRNIKNGKVFKNTHVQTASEPAEFDSQNTKTKNSLAIQTTQTQDVSTESVIEFGTQTETINVIQSLNFIRKISNNHKTVH